MNANDGDIMGVVKGRGHGREREVGHTLARCSVDKGQLRSIGQQLLHAALREQLSCQQMAADARCSVGFLQPSKYCCRTGDRGCRLMLMVQIAAASNFALQQCLLFLGKYHCFCRVNSSGAR